MSNHGAKTVRQRGGDLTSGRKFNADELQLMLLYFLSNSSAHGYALIKRFNDVSQGFYSPSPGVLYPALGQLETQGFALVELKGKRKNYRLTPAGHKYLALHTERTQQLLAILKHAAKKMLWMNQANESMTAASDATGWLPEFVQARQALQAALLIHSDADYAEQRRIISILQRAADDILKGSASKD